MFRDIETIPDFPKYERETLEYWSKLDPISKLKELRKDSPEFVYYDGPITANGRPHYGHAVTWTMKDIIPRYQTMKGNYVSRNMGWDCQGILVEVEIEKELGFKHKKEIEEYGIAKFNDYCRSSVLKLKDLILEYEYKFGRFIDHSDEYFTMDPKFIESMWWSFKELYAKGLLYEDYKVVAYSTRAGTTLSSHEVKDGGYKDVEDDYVLVKFKLKDEDSYLLAYTTTPWTLPGNLLIGIKKNASYSKVRINNETLIVASELVKTLFTENFEIIEEFDAEKLVNKSYEPIFPHFSSKTDEGAFKVILAEHATTTDGTGLVHLAPYGEEDYEILRTEKIKAFDYLDETANFTELVPEYQGLFYKEANPRIIADLGMTIFRTGKVIHRMPMCYRTGFPLIYKPIKSWYLNIQKIKNRLIEENDKVRWVPEHVRKGNSGSWIENAKDWSLSRNRYWGTPMPIWINDKTGDIKVIGSFAELEELSGQKLTDPHRPYVDEITFTDAENGGTFRRVKDVVDVWYDSGSVPFAKVYYPNNKELFNQKFPAQYISEGMDQTHLWFYTMMILGVALFDKAPFENVIVTGMMLDKNSKKLSKSKGNYPPMDEVLDNYGADIFRYVILTSPLVEGEFTRFYDEVLKDAKKEFFLIFWNTLKFFNTYANSSNFNPTGKLGSEDVLDKWILARLKEVKLSIETNLESYKVMPAAREFAPFMNDLSTWYVRRSRDRIKDGDNEALETLYFVLVELTKLMAPFFPFISEKAYEILDVARFSKLESVHFEIIDFKLENLTSEEKELLEKMSKDREIISNTLALRTNSKISLRQALNQVYLSEKVSFEEIFKEELNIKNIIYTQREFQTEFSNEDRSIILDTYLTQELLDEGKVREFIRKIQDMRKNHKLNISDKIKLFYSETDISSLLIEKNREIFTKKLNAIEFEVADESSILPL
jgi:isoleucyl-tRNA synthetase